MTIRTAHTYKLKQIKVRLYSIPVQKRVVNKIMKVVHGVSLKEVEKQVLFARNGVQQALIGSIGEIIAVSVLQSEGIQNVHILRGASAQKTPFDILLGKSISAAAKDNFNIQALVALGMHLVEVKSSKDILKKVVLSPKQSKTLLQYPAP